MSHMLDVSMFGRNAGSTTRQPSPSHANAVLLFPLAPSMTGAFWRSAFVAALFDPPLHVESVAWLAERKDVLS